MCRLYIVLHETKLSGSRNIFSIQVPLRPAMIDGKEGCENTDGVSATQIFFSRHGRTIKVVYPCAFLTFVLNQVSTFHEILVLFPSPSCQVRPPAVLRNLVIRFPSELDDSRYVRTCLIKIPCPSTLRAPMKGEKFAPPG